MSLIHIYACGGTGINIAGAFLNKEKKEGHADVRVTFCDTSTSNFGKLKPPKDSIFLLEGADGSGGVRKENSAPISDGVPSLLVNHPPGDLNILVSSGTGGTGSVYVPYIATTLIAAKVPTIALIINTSDSKKRVDNAVDTMKSLEGIASKRNAVLPCCFYENKGVLDPEVDEKVRSVISSLIILYSGNNFGLDSKDLYNWVSPHLSVNARPGVAWLRVITGDELQNDTVKDPVSIATLYKGDETTDFPHTPDFSVFGKNAISDFPQDLYYVISYEWVNKLVENLYSLQSKLSETAKARSKITAIRFEDGDLDDDGVCI